jgi:hypothetical protein
MFGLSLWMAPFALAKYVPPAKPSAPKDTLPRITRSGSCNAKVSGQLMALAPVSHVGQSVSKRPMFVWYVPDQESYPLEFWLLDVEGQPLYQANLPSQPGLMQFSLPPDQPDLRAGQTYRWQVVMICNPNSPSESVIIEATINVVEPPLGLPTQLAASRTPQQRIDLYSENGLWYDALAEAIKGDRSRRYPSVVADLLNSLAQAEAQSLKEWSDYLKQIGAMIGQHDQP